MSTSSKKSQHTTSTSSSLKKSRFYDEESARSNPNVARIYQGFNLDQSDDSRGKDHTELSGPVQSVQAFVSIRVGQLRTPKELKDLPTQLQKGHLGHSSFLEKCLVFVSYLIAVLTFPLSLFLIFVVVRQFERAVILRNGKLRSTVPYGPGLIQYLPCVDSVKFTDLRIICYEVPPQEALTKDALTVAADAVVFYKIYDPIWAVVNIADYKISTQFLAATTLRNALGTRKLSDILCDRPAVSFQVFGNMKNLTMNWGVKIVGFELKDISLPLQLQKAMATEAESYRLANAKIIVAKSEIESTRNLQKATKLLMDNPYCMQLRYLQALQMIAGDKTHTVVIPFSPESLKKMFK